MRRLIINADGYGFTEGISRATEECVEFGTVRSLSANVNFERASTLAALVARHPDLSVGCHLNPVVGPPVLPPERVSSLLGPGGEFHYRDFARLFRAGRIRRDELRAELLAQIGRTRELAGAAFSHVDFHMGLHRLPGLYTIFLEVAEASGTGRIRTHRYRTGLESDFPRLKHAAHLLRRPDGIPKYVWNLLLRWKARARGFAMPDYWVLVTDMVGHPERITTENYLRMLRHLPDGFSEFVAHPAYPDDELRRYSTYLEPRLRELHVLVSPEFREGLRRSGVALAGYRDIPIPKRSAGRSNPLILAAGRDAREEERPEP